MSPTQGAPWPEPRMQTPETQRRVALTAEPGAEGGEGGPATQPRPGRTHLCREARIFRVLWDASITATPSTLFVAFSSAKSYKPAL